MIPIATDSPTSDPTKIAEGAQVEGLEDTEFHSDVLDDAPVPDVTDNEPYAELGEFDNFDGECDVCWLYVCRLILAF